MKRLAYIAVRFLILIFSIIPFPLLYGLSTILFVLLFHLLRYRRGLVRQNLQKAFPEKELAEIKKIEKQYYRNLCDLILESIKGLSLSEAELRQRYPYLNPELIDEICETHGSCILTGSHCGNWEWGVLSFPLWVQANVVGIFKPLSNPYLDAYLSQLRTRWGLNLSTMSHTGRAIIEYRKQKTVFVFIADQSPSSTPHAHWIPFLYQDTAFIHGPDKIARSTGYPVLFFAIKRRKRGFYEVQFELLTEQPKQMSEGAITQLYAQKLEAQIRQYPADWLWSHRRWKRTRS